MIIKVEQKHIKKGKPRNINFCPVALAIAEQVEGLSSVRVRQTDIGIGKDGYIYYTNSPPKVCMFVSNFDEGMPVKPFSFELN